MFQSRAGFSPRRDHSALRCRSRSPDVSIPCWVFSSPRPQNRLSTLPTSAVSIPCWVFSSPRPFAASAYSRVASGFNPVLGFLLAATDLTVRRVHSLFVSIPCWVFSSPRHYGLDEDPIDGRFNPVLGFLLAATIGPFDTAVSYGGFNPVLGFLLAATERTGWPRSLRRRVSIPCWVFSSPRPPCVAPTSVSTGSFNPVLGFLLAATVSVLTAAHLRHCFNPVLGFLLAATFEEGDTDDPDALFQSRAGFSPRRDAPSAP